MDAFVASNASLWTQISADDPIPWKQAVAATARWWRRSRKREVTEVAPASAESPPARLAARVVVLDEQNRTLLLRYDEEGRRFWALPGGTLEQDESYEAAARRELVEELGIYGVVIGPQVAARDTGSHPDRRVVERYFTARISSADLVRGTPTQPDQIRGYRWWTRAELQTTEEVVYPTALAGLISMLIEDDAPLEPIQLQP